MVLNTLVTPLVKKGQPLTHIFAEHGAEIPVSQRMPTLLFVKQNLMLILLMRDGKADTVAEQCDWPTSAVGLETFRKLFPVILTDNGSEFKRTRELEFTADGQRRMQIFYCDLQASWQKPHIEKNHEYIRYVLPRGKSFSPYT